MVETNTLSKLDMQSAEMQKLLDQYIGRRLREKRQKRGLTLSDMADKLAVSHQQIQKYEQAQSRISAYTLFQLSEILGVDPGYFYHGYESYYRRLEKAQLNGEMIVHDRESVFNVLIVEDNAADELLTRRAFKCCSITTNLLVLHDAYSTIDFLRNKITNVDFPRPDLILLDLNLPKNDGVSILREIKRDREINDIPVVILTNSLSYNDMLSCYKNNASGFICKSFEFDVFQRHVESCLTYWSKTVVLPNRAQGTELPYHLLPPLPELEVSESIL